MKRNLIIRPEAESEMTEAFEWYEARVPELGSSFLLCLDAVFNSILRTPGQFPYIHKNVRRALIRRFPYEVFFLEEIERVIILSVFHAKRNPKHWRSRV